jgi:hypothetical protein
MRKMATVKKMNDGLVKRVIVYDSGNGVYIFPCASLEDGSTIGDNWIENVAQADEYCMDEFGIGAEDWEHLDDPLEDCQHDWIAPVRVKGRNIGQPQWGHVERLEDGIWKDFEPASSMPKASS